MPTNTTKAILFSGIVIFILSCSPKNISTKYYYQHEKVLTKIEDTYKKIYPENPFTVAFTDRNFKTVLLEIITDTLTYIYEFNLDEQSMTDTLNKFKFNTPKVVELIRQMQSIRCTWVNKFDYYVDEKKHTLTFLSIKPVALKPLFSYHKYYILTYFPQPQYFDSTGQLLDKRRLGRLRKINGEIFKRINDKVCYTISGNFR
ncbi:MAG: hypothetical protein SGI83_07935 [Bacteroidota bacterium]|nr:hypothetical protein [Bacteroidota bacterium]